MNHSRAGALRAFSAVAAGTLAWKTARPARADTVTLALGAMPTDASAQAFYALDRGAFKAAGIDVTLTVLTNTASIASAVSAGAVDIGYGSVVPLAEAHNRGLSFKAIAPAGMYAGPPSTLVMMVSKRSTAKTGADLNGKTIAVNGLRDLTQYTAEAWIAQNGGDIKTIKLVEIPFSEMGNALDAGRVDAAIVGEPYMAADLGVARVIGDAGGAVAKKYYITTWFATEAWLNAHPALAHTFVNVMRDTAIWANTHHAESAEILRRYSKITPEVMATMVRSTYGDAPRLEPPMLQPVIDVAVKYGTTAPTSAADLIWH
jgi:NitT/TauT family transport system substrate-binding protein